MPDTPRSFSFGAAGTGLAPNESPSSAVPVSAYMKTLLTQPDQATLLGGLGLGPQVDNLEKYAAIAGITLGAGTAAADQPAFDAAKAAMDARSGLGGLYVFVPPGIYDYRLIQFGNNSGYFCNINSVTLRHSGREASDNTEWASVSLSDPYATQPCFYGFTLTGTWNYGVGAYASAPETDPWLDKQHAVEFYSAFNGSTDTNYYARSRINSQEPRTKIGELTIAEFAGDGFRWQGAGASTVMRLDVQNVGGRGVYWNGYDSKGAIFDLGNTGREGFYLDNQGASCQFIGVKVWYTGQRKIAGAQSGFRMVSTGTTHFTACEAQDMTGDGVIIDRCFDMKIDISVQYQGDGAGSQAAPTAALVLMGVVASRINIGFNIPGFEANPGGYPNVTRLVRDVLSINPYQPYSQYNKIDFTQAGWPGDTNTWMPEWFEGPMDTTNKLSVNGMERIPGRWIEYPDGQAPFGLQMNNSLVGLAVKGAASPYPGQAVLIHQGYGAIQGFASGVYTPAVECFPHYVGVGLPLALPQYTMATLPDATAIPRALAFCTDAPGGPTVVQADTANWITLTGTYVAG